MYSVDALEDNGNCCGRRELSMFSTQSAEEPSWLAVTVPVAAVDPLAVSARLGGSTLYWERPLCGEAVAGFGIAASHQAERVAVSWAALDEFSSPGKMVWLEDSPQPPGPWFGGLAFDPNRPASELWRGFPASKWILPRMLVWRRGDRSYLTAFHSPDDGFAAGRKAVSERAKAAVAALPTEGWAATEGAVELRVRSAREPWNELVDLALGAIRARSLSKVVLARRIDVEGSRPLDPIAILMRLRAQVPGCTLFLFRAASGASFLGASPETLCRIDHRGVETEALAGSAPNPGEPLASTDKESREHGAVIEGIDQSLRPLCAEISIDAAPSVLGLPYLRHLRTAIRGQLRPGVRPFQVVSALHPTAAVGGAPRNRALRFLAQHEKLDRGWYAGPIGWLGEERADLAVAIRSALVHDGQAHLFVGAGVVAGSTAEGEWQETEAKSRTLLEAMGGRRAD